MITQTVDTVVKFRESGNDHARPIAVAPRVFSEMNVGTAQKNYRRGRTIPQDSVQELEPLHTVAATSLTQSCYRIP